ncbi:hypothetical protein D3C78_1093730 [compost metagenome]
MRAKLLLCVPLLLCPQAWADERSALQLSELDSRSQLLCASAMLYFNPQDRTPDPRLLTSVFHHLQTLETDVQQLGQPAALAQPLQGMKRTFAELDGLPPAQKQRYPALVQQLLAHQHALQQAADQASARTEQDLPPSTAHLFSMQSRDLASFLLDYQLRHYPLPDRAQSGLPPERQQALDQAIETRFARLEELHPEHAATLGKIRLDYRFVRGQLQQAKGRAQGGAEFYLSRAVTDLDELALTVVLNSR